MEICEIKYFILLFMYEYYTNYIGINMKYPSKIVNTFYVQYSFIILMRLIIIK